MWRLSQSDWIGNIELSSSSLEIKEEAIARYIPHTEKVLIEILLFRLWQIR